MEEITTSRVEIIETMAKAVWRSYGAGTLNWDDVHPYVQQQHRNDAIVALEAALPLIYKTIYNSVYENQNI